MGYEKMMQKKEIYLQKKHLISKNTIKSLEQSFDIMYAHNSTAIEGNTLTLMETKILLEDEISVGGKNLREIYEIINHNKAYNYIKKCIKDNENLTENKIKDIHNILMESIIIGGIYRNESVYISGAMHTPPSPMKMYEQIKIFYNDLQYKELNEIELAAYTHAEFVKIHPFIDGNGRTARLIMNYQLMKNNLPAVSIAKEDRLEYFNTLEEYAVNNNLRPFTDMILNLVDKRLDIYVGLIQESKYINNITMKKHL